MITQAELKSIVHYDPDTGIFTRLLSWGSTKKGDVAGSKSSYYKGKTYLRLSVKCKIYYAHRLAFLYMNGVMPKFVDHKNGDGTDNRWINIRESSPQHNQKNMRLSSVNLSGFTGVSKCHNSDKWRARLMVGGVEVSLGRFDNIDDAIDARKAANIKYGYDENHGSIRPL